LSSARKVINSFNKEQAHKYLDTRVFGLCKQGDIGKFQASEPAERATTLSTLSGYPVRGKFFFSFSFVPKLTIYLTPILFRCIKTSKKRLPRL